MPKVEKGEPPAFPEERFEDLLVKGFCAAGRHDYRGMLLTLLLHGAGFRESEPFHLYICDVFPDPANPRQAKVLIHHPSHGAAPADWRDERGRPRNGSRAEYLVHQFGLPPRTDLMDRRHAGRSAPLLSTVVGFVMGAEMMPCQPARSTSKPGIVMFGYPALKS
ncbi:hypothetical protein [Burkholderia ubonensis]|uniref:hypothetical protein n=1 Tax=Burkholderia ubonensis TaxID=101571 RepID=UPI001E50FC03|nr:hypothetical protein [Burkholderia ubonensis]